ncbi:MAG: hypothetical protein V4676_03760 [Bacteroidota bacterium]
MDLIFEKEQDAAAAILFSCTMQNGTAITNQQVEQLSRTIVLCSRWRGEKLNELTKKAMVLQAGYSTKEVIETASKLIQEEFRETLFAMVCEVMLLDGTIDDERTAVVAMLALHLGISTERMKMILATYLIRNKWNVQVVEH